jgi:hypothetical protein
MEAHQHHVARGRWQLLKVAGLDAHNSEGAVGTHARRGAEEVYAASVVSLRLHGHSTKLSSPSNRRLQSCLLDVLLNLYPWFGGCHICNVTRSGGIHRKAHTINRRKASFSRWKPYERVVHDYFF